jgi:hypothetical protein
MYRKLFGTLGLLVSVFGANACAFDAGGTGNDASGKAETLGEIHSAFTAVPCGATYDGCWDQVDSTGSIQVRMYMCKPSAVGSLNGSTCPVEADRVLVGGGGRVEGGNSNIGALLWGSLPPAGSLKGASWQAFSKDHVYSNPHQVRAFALGLKLKTITMTDYPATQLASVIVQTAASSGSSTGGGAAVALTPPDATSPGKRNILLGGGALTHWSGSGSMPSCPAGLGYCLDSKGVTTSGPSGSGYHSQFSTLDSANSVVIAVGGETFYNGWGRMLVGLWPNSVSNGMAVMTSKDHGFADTGNDLASYVALQRIIN